MTGPGGPGGRPAGEAPSGGAGDFGGLAALGLGAAGRLPAPEAARAFAQLQWRESGPGEPWLDERLGASRADWPGGARWAVALTHDVDFITSRLQHRYLFRRLWRCLAGAGPRLQGARMVLGSLVRLLSELPPRERYGDLADWMRLEERCGFRSTFFFLPYGTGGLHILDGDYRYGDRITFDGRPATVAEAIREIHQAGWEVGLHGTILSATRPGLLARQKRELEDVIQAEVVSVRHHFLSYDPGATPGLQAAAGFRYDSTHGLNDRWGFPTGTCRPYPLWDPAAGRPAGVLELPLAAMDTAEGLPGLAPASLAGKLERLGGLLKQTERLGGALVLNWHPNYWHLGIARDCYQGVLERIRSLGPHVGPLGSVGAAWAAMPAVPPPARAKVGGSEFDSL